MLDGPLHSGRAVVSLSNSKRRRLVKNSAFAFRYFGSRCNAVKTFCAPLDFGSFDSFFPTDFSIFNQISEN